MIRGLGIDAASISRARALIERFGERFTRRAFTELERSYCDSRRDPAQSYAGRFAAKEAVMKVLHSGWGSGVRFKEIEVQRGKTGQPLILLNGNAKRRADQLEISDIHVSLTHEGDLALAVAVAEREEN